MSADRASRSLASKDDTKPSEPSSANKASEKPVKIKNTSKETAKPARSAVSDVQNQSLSEILGAVKNIQATLKCQGDKLTKVSDRVENLEQSYDFFPENEGEYFDYEVEEAEPEEGLTQQGQDQSVKRKAEDEPTCSRFSNMSKRFKTQELCDCDIDGTLATNITELFRNGMDDDKYSDMTKDEANARPENCEGLVSVRLNRLIWDAVSSQARTSDKKMMNIETSIVKAACILAKTVNKMAEVEKQHASFGDMIDSCNDVLALLGHSNKQINMMRRDLLRPEMKGEYSHLCNHSHPFTKELFGDDVSKTAKEIEDCAKVGYKIHRGGKFGAVRGRLRGRSGYSRGVYHRGRGYNSGYGQAGSTSGSGTGYYGQSKNYQRMGAVRQPLQKQ